MNRTMVHRNRLRTLLLLGRVSNLPTVWSNCLAGWLLAGRGQPLDFLLLCLGATFLYLGGMFLNDAFDTNFDNQHRKERPIPSGAIHAAAVWQWGFSWLGLGLLCFALIHLNTLIIGVTLAICIIVYNTLHKILDFSPFLMAACRFLLVIAASSAAAWGVTGLSIWTALVLGAYIVGLSYVARNESTQGPLRYWPLIFLLAPVVLAMIINRDDYLLRGLVLSAVVLAWVLNCARHAYWGTQRNIGRMVGGLLAGIVLVDLLAVADASLPMIFIFLGLFLAALTAQRFIPAT